MFGVPDLLSSMTGNKLGNSLMRADKATLEIDDVDRATEIYLRRTNSGGNEVTKEDLARNGQLTGLIGSLSYSKVQTAFFDKLGVTSSETEFKQWVRELPGVRNEITNEFDATYFRQWWVNQGFRSETEFQKALLEEFTQGKVSEGLRSSLTVPNGMSTLAALYNAEERNVALFSLQTNTLNVEFEEPTPQDIEQTYFERQEALTQPERRQMSMIAVRPEDFGHLLEIEEETLRNEYQAQIGRFTTGVQRAYDRLTFADLETAQSNLGRLLGGASPDDLGLVPTSFEPAERSELVDPQLAASVFDAPLNFWSGPVIGLDGTFSLTLATSETEGIVSPFDDVSEILRDELTVQRAERQVDRVIDELDDAVGAGLSLEEISTQIGTPVYTFPAVDRRGFTEDGQFVRTLAELQGALALGFDLYTGDSSDRRDGETVQYIVRLDRIVDPFIPELDVIRDDLTEAVSAQNRQAAIQNLIEEKLQNIRDGVATIDSVAEDFGVSVIRPDTSITRTSGVENGLPSGVVGIMFGAKLDEPFQAPTQIGRIIGVVEGIRYPDQATLSSMAFGESSTLTAAVHRDIMDGIAYLAQESVAVEYNQPQIDAYISQYASTE